MVISLAIAISIATMLNLINTIQTNPNCENTYSIISQIQYPQNIQLESLKYSTPYTHEKIKQAWEHAYQAKTTAYNIKNNIYLCSFLNAPVPKWMRATFYIFLEELSQTKTNYYKAINQASVLFSYEIKQAQKDYIKMDELGFDKLKIGLEKNQFEKTKKLLLTNTNLLNPSNVYELQSEQETILSNLKKKGITSGVKFFNEFLGNKQAISLYEENHKRTIFLINNFEKNYKQTKKQFTEEKKLLNEKINNLQNQEVSGINPNFEKNIQTNFNSIIFTNPKPPNKQLTKIKAKNKLLTTIQSDYIYSSKQEDYLVNSYLLLSKNKLELDYLIKQADDLNNRLNEIKENMHQQCLNELKKLHPTNSYYAEVEEKCNSKINLKQDIESYSEAIKIARGDYEDYDYLQIYLKKSISQLQKFNLNLDYENQQLKNINQNKASINQKYASLYLLKKQIEKKAKPIINSFNNKQELLEEYFNIVNQNRELFQLPLNEFNEDKQELILISSQDFLPNCFDFTQKQNNLIRKYNLLITTKASKYFENKLNYLFFFNKIPECNNNQEVTEVTSIFNDLTPLNDVKLKASIFDAPEEFFIPFFDYGSLFSKQFNSTQIVLKCENQNESKQGNYFIASRKVSPKYPLQKARIKFTLPSNAFITSSSGLFINQSVYVENLNQSQVIFVIYSLQNNEVNNSFPLTPNDSNFVNDSFFNPINMSTFLKNNLNKSNFLNQSQDFDFLKFKDNESLNSFHNDKYNDSPSFAFEKNNKKTNSLNPNSSDLVNLNSLLFAYKKAVDDEVQIKHNKTISNFSYYQKQVNSLTGLSIQEFNLKSSFIKLDLKQKINLLKNQAEQDYNLAISKGDNEFLKRSKFWFDKGYYTRSIIYSNFALNLLEKNNPEWVFLIAFLVIVFSSYLALRKDENKIQKKIKRKLYSFD